MSMSESKVIRTSTGTSTTTSTSTGVYTNISETAEIDPYSKLAQMRKAERRALRKQRRLQKKKLIKERDRKLKLKLKHGEANSPNYGPSTANGQANPIARTTGTSTDTSNSNSNSNSTSTHGDDSAKSKMKDRTKGIIRDTDTKRERDFDTHTQQRRKKKKLKSDTLSKPTSESQPQSSSCVQNDNVDMKKNLNKRSAKASIPTDASNKDKESQPISFPINEECTSLVLSPSGRHVIAGFTDGTLRLFDTTGRLWKNSSTSGKDSLTSVSSFDEVDKEMEDLFDCDSSESESDEQSIQLSPSSSKIKEKYVVSRSHQNFGAVASQIHARGVITSLLMDVACCEDGSFAFGGVLRGSTELIAINLSPLEMYHDQYENHPESDEIKNVCILDLVKVYRFSDAKLKGFGACTRLKNTSRPEYRLFTGKGIKNMHIWSFIPPQGNRTEPLWQCLYDTPTNGNTIKYLSFRTDSNGLLQGISKSDDQKLRIWDLSYEQQVNGGSKIQSKSVIKQLAKKALAERYPDKKRPKRPPYIDVVATENALGVYGPYIFFGGESMFNKMGVMFLDVEDVQSPFNHEEFALPNANGVDESRTSGGRRSGRSGRQQRGDLKSVSYIAGLSSDSTDVILGLSDGSLVHYNNPREKQASVKLLPSTSSGNETNGMKVCISRFGKNNVTILTQAMYDSNSARGNISMKYLSTSVKVMTGFCEPNEGLQQHFPQEITLTSSVNDDKANVIQGGHDEFNTKTPNDKKTNIDRENHINAKNMDSKLDMKSNTKKEKKQKSDSEKLVDETDVKKVEKKSYNHTRKAVEEINTRKEKKSHNDSTQVLKDTNTKKEKRKNLYDDLKVSNDTHVKKQKKSSKDTQNTEKVSKDTNTKKKKNLYGDLKVSKDTHVKKEKKRCKDTQNNIEQVSKDTNLKKEKRKKPHDDIKIPKDIKTTGEKKSQNKTEKVSKDTKTKTEKKSHSDTEKVSKDTKTKKEKRQKLSDDVNVLKKTNSKEEKKSHNDTHKESKDTKMKKEKKKKSYNDAGVTKEANSKKEKKNQHYAQKEINHTVEHKQHSVIIHMNNSSESEVGIPINKSEDEFENLSVTPDPKNLSNRVEINDTCVKDKMSRFSDISTVCQSSPQPNLQSEHATVEKSIVSPSTQTSTSGNAVSPERPIPKALEFHQEPTKDLVSITKYFRPSKDIKKKAKKVRKSKKEKDVKEIVAHDKIDQVINCQEALVPKIDRPSTPQEKENRKENKKEKKVRKSKKEKDNNEMVASDRIDQVSTRIYQEAVVPKTDGPSTHKKNKNKRSPNDPLESMSVASGACRMSSVIQYKKAMSKMKASRRLKEMKEVEIEQSKSTNISITPQPTFNQKHGMLNKMPNPIHFTARKKMILHHRAEHERLRNAILSSVHQLIKSLSINYTYKLNDARCMLDDILQDHNEIMRNLIHRQQMEAAALAATQSLENGNTRAPEVQVSFPFPEVFDHAHNVAIRFLTEKVRTNARAGK